MTPFFGFASLLSMGLLIASIALGLMGSGYHLLFALGATFWTISVHCLVFGIFTGAGKDTRELCQDLALDTSFVVKTKSFRKITFPPALYAILLVLITAIMGGSLSTGHWSMRYVHLGLAIITLLYNAKAFWIEYQAVKENAAVLKKVNAVAAQKATDHPELAAVENFESEEVIDGLGGYSWGTHVYALGKFLCFLSYNTWLPFLYMKYIMGMIRLSPWPFVAVSIVLLIAGILLRTSYKSFKPTHA